MKLQSVRTILLPKLLERQVLFAASGYESRGRRAFKGKAKVEEKYCVAFAEDPYGGARPENDRFFRARDFEPLAASGTEGGPVYEQLTACLRKGRSTFAIDISCMTRVWYGSIVMALQRHQLGCGTEPIVVDFIYTPGRRTASTEQLGVNSALEPVPGFASFMLPDRPPALVLGVGGDVERAFGVCSFIDAPHVTLFAHSQANHSRRHPTHGSLRPDEWRATVHRYHLSDPATTFSMLDSACRALSPNWRVVLASVAPKMFSLICFLVATLHHDVSVWRVSRQIKATDPDVKPAGLPIVMRTVWIADSEQED